MYGSQYFAWFGGKDYGERETRKGTVMSSAADNKNSIDAPNFKKKKKKIKRWGSTNTYSVQYILASFVSSTNGAY